MKDRIIELARQVIASEYEDVETRKKIALKYFDICSRFSSRLGGYGHDYLIGRALFDVYILDLAEIEQDELKVMTLFCLLKYIRKCENGEIEIVESSLASAYALSFLLCSENGSFIYSLMVNDGYVNAGQRVGLLIIYLYHFIKNSSVSVSFVSSIDKRLERTMAEAEKDLPVLSSSDTAKLCSAGRSIIDELIKQIRHLLYESQESYGIF